MESSNIRISYLYRDASNYKKFGFVIFSNSDNLELVEVKEKLQKLLISEEFFIPEELGLPRLSFENYVPSLDHDWHEIENIETTGEETNDIRDIAMFLRK